MWGLRKTPLKCAFWIILSKLSQTLYLSIIKVGYFTYFTYCADPLPSPTSAFVAAVLFFPDFDDFGVLDFDFAILLDFGLLASDLLVFLAFDTVLVDFGIL